MMCERSQFHNRFGDPPYFDTTCKNCGVPIKHTGATSGITWIEPGTEQASGSGLGRWECGPCPTPACRPGTFHQHVPLEVVSEAEVTAALASIQTSIQNGAPHA